MVSLSSHLVKCDMMHSTQRQTLQVEDSETGGSTKEDIDDRKATYLECCQTSTEHRSYNLWVDVLRKHSQVACIENSIFLEAAISMVQMVA